MSDAYLIRPYESKDRDAFRRLVAGVLPTVTDARFEAWWWWRIPGCLWLVCEAESGELAGMVALLPLSVYHRGVVTEGAWQVDMHLLPKHQRKGLGSRMTRLMISERTFLSALQHSPGSLATLTKLGWSPAQPVERAVCPLGLIPGMRLVGGRAARLFAAPVTSVPISGPEVFDAAFDACWDAVKDKLSPLAVRDRAALAARFGRTAPDGHRLFTCREGGRLRGYLVTRLLERGGLPSLRRFRAGVLVDFLADPDDRATLSALIGAAQDELWREGAEMLYTMTSRPEYLSVLTRHGFLHAGIPLKPLKRLRTTFDFISNRPELGLDERPWTLSFADSDVEP